MSTKALREELKVKLQTVCSEAHEQKGNEKRIGAGFVDVYGPQVRLPECCSGREPMYRRPFDISKDI